MLQVNQNQIPNLVVEKVLPPEQIGIQNKWFHTFGMPGRLLGSAPVPYIRRVKGRIFGETKAEALQRRREIIHALTSPDLIRLDFEHEDTYELAKLESYATDDWKAGTLPVDISFYCPHGLAFGQTKTAPIGAVTVTGTYKTPPIIRITPSATTVEIVLGQKRLRFVGITTTPQLVIDVAKRTAMQGTTSRMSKLTMESDFFELSPGVNNLSITGGTGTVEYTERFI